MLFPALLSVISWKVAGSSHPAAFQPLAPSSPSAFAGLLGSRL